MDCMTRTNSLSQCHVRHCYECRKTRENVTCQGVLFTQSFVLVFVSSMDLFSTMSRLVVITILSCTEICFNFLLMRKLFKKYFCKLRLKQCFAYPNFLEISFLTVLIWLEPNDPVIDFVLLSAGHSQVSASVFFSFKL